jgi:hypothetical protein
LRFSIGELSRQEEKAKRMENQGKKAAGNKKSSAKKFTDGSSPATEWRKIVAHGATVGICRRTNQAPDGAEERFCAM